jgi:cell wall-associated NlpC family hydrolase
MAALAVASTLAGCAGPGPAPDPTPVRVVPPPDSPVLDPLRLQVIFSAMQQVGVPYAWGGATPSGFDCSGLVQYVYRNAGLALPRTAAEQLGAASPLPLRDAVPGDLLFFRDQGSTSHVGIYIGDGRFVHAPRTGRTVSLETFEGSAYWRARFAGAGRVLPAL